MVDLSRIAFIDFEASSLSSGSFPTEIGWAIPDQDPSLIRSGSCLIRPLAKWLRSTTAWSRASEALTGISTKLLEEQGVSPVQAMQQLFAVIANRDLYSDEPPFDFYWLSMLAEAGDVEMGDRKLGDAKKLIADIVGSNTGLKHALHEAEEYAAQSIRRKHRAEADARRLALVFSRLVHHTL